MLVLAAFCLSPLTLYAQRLSVTPPTVTIMEGDSGEFTVVLTAKPTGNVTVTIVKFNDAEISLDKTELTFTPSNWNIGQTVTFTAAEDEDTTDDDGTVILIARGGGYDGDGVVIRPVAVTIDSPGKTIQLNATIHDQDGSSVTGVPFDWSSADSSVAVVDSTGKVTAVNFGETTITAALAAVPGTATISGEATVRVASGIAQDRAALVALYNATDGPDWINNENWLTAAPLGEWYGVETDGAGRIVSLDLSGRWDSELSEHIPNGLAGPIPPELGNLANLELLDLGFNYVTGSIPSELGNLARLRTLTLAGNNLNGPIPSELGNLAQLRYLHLDFNNLNGPIPSELGNLAQLQFLLLDGNNLNGPIPSELGNLAQLLFLDLGGNNLNGPIPPELGNLGQLVSLSLGGNNLNGPIPPELGNLDRLWQSSLASNALTGAVPPEFGDLTNLNSFYLSNNKLSGTIPLSFQQLPNLMEFRFADNIDLCLPEILLFWYEAVPERNGPVCPDREVLQALYETAGGDGWTNATGWLSDTALGQWYGVEEDSSGRVSTVDLAGNNLSGDLPRRLGELAGLTALRIRDNALTGRLPRSLILTPLHELDYANTGLCVPNVAAFQTWLAGISFHEGTGEECPPLSDREILEVLHQATNGPGWNASGNWLTDAPLGEWHGVETNVDGRVTSLDLRFNELRGLIPPELGGLAELETLILSGNLLSGPIPPDLGNLAKTKLIVLARNRLSGPIPPELSGLSSVNGLFLYINQLTSIPPDLGELSSLKVLGLHHNQLRSIPPELGQLSSLEILGLHYNQLTSIPPDLGELSSLKFLALHYNQLASIPPELGELSQLEELRLSSNQLTSVPPELGQMKNLVLLELDENQLTSIPPELGQMENLTRLFLSDNQLASIPEELSALNSLELLFLEGNRLASFPHLPSGFPVLRLLDLSSNDFMSFPSELGELDFLQVLVLGGNRLTDIPTGLGQVADASQIVSRFARPPSSLEKWIESGDPWGLDSDESRFAPVSRKLDRLKDLRSKIDGLRQPTMVVHGLTGFPNLEVLDLSSNELSGPLPEGLLELTELGTLGLNDNADLAGPLPLGLTAFERLEDLHTAGTGLCAPAVPEFLDWLNGVTRQRVAHCERGESTTAYLTQAVQSREFPVPLVAGEPALLRVFLTVKAGSANLPPVRATFYRDGTVIHREEIPGTSDPIPTKIDESSLSKSANAEIPGPVIQPGLEVVIEPDPDGMLDPMLGVARRIPAAGRMVIDVRAMPVFEVTLVPFLWQQSPDPSIIDTVTAMATDPQGHELFERTHLLLPVSEINATAHQPVTTSTNNGFDLLDQVEMIRVAEGGRGHYLAVMAPPTTPGGLNGVAYGIGSWSSFSILDSEIIAHEFGHNRALYHAPCGEAGGPDPFYPYELGNIGAWGYDFDAAELVPPSQPDFMSYCDPTWTSDYQFTNAVRYRLETEIETGSSLIAAADIAQTDSGRTLMLWGGLNGEGEPYLRPSFFFEAPPKLPEADGPWSIIGTDGADSVLFSLSFAMSEFTDTDDERAGFTFAAPVTWTQELVEITLEGPGGSAILDRDTDQPMTILRDTTTGRIRGILNGALEVSALGMAAIGDEDTENIQILFSRGIPDPADANR